MSDVSSSLSDLGWGDRWAALLTELDSAALRPGRVVRRDRGSAVVATGDATVAVATAGADVATGDWVAMDGNRMAGVLPRHGVLRRRGPDGAEQVLASNVDVVLLVCGLDRPVKPGRIHRGVVQAWDAGAAALAVLTKADLVPDPEPFADDVAREAPGLDVLTVSSPTGEGLAEVREALAGRTAALVGESGAGKSTLLNALAGAELADTGDVRRGDAKGRHTTTRRELHVIPGTGRIIDTPGLRAFGLAAERSAVEAAFGDVEELALGCRFRDCRHAGEPGCAVTAAVDAGALRPHRLEQYHRLQREVASEILRSNPHERHRHERRFAHQVREILKQKGRDG